MSNSGHNCGMPDWATITEFANRYRLKAKRDPADDTVTIAGKNGSNIYEYSDSELGVCFVTPVKLASRAFYWRKYRAACLAAGMTLRQNGDAEGALSFNPNNPIQAKLAVKLAGVRAKRRMSPEAVARLASVGTAALKARRPTQEGLV